ncbi:MAG: hypothetical protein ACOYVF_04430 [Candidatus Zixiibacteriota bacterium]
MNFINQLHEKFYRQAELIAADLRQDPSVLAVILSGPLALDKVSDNDKLYFIVITDKDDGVIEHHFLDDGWGEVKHPVEMGKFPLAVATFLTEKGYSDMVSYKSLESFRCGRVLWEKDRIGSKIIEASEKHLPAKTFIGESLHGAVSALDDAVSLYKNKNYENAVLMAREAAVKAVEMVARDNVGESTFSILEAAEKFLSSDEFRLFQQLMDIEEVDAHQAEECARSAKEFAFYALRAIGVTPEQVLDTGDKE